MSLLIECGVRLITPLPANTALELSRFRVSGAGQNSQFRDVTLTDGQTHSLGAGTWSEVVLRTSRQVSVVITKPDNSTVTHAVDQLLVLTSQFKDLAVSFSKLPSEPATTAASIKLVFA